MSIKEEINKILSRDVDFEDLIHFIGGCIFTTFLFIVFLGMVSAAIFGAVTLLGG